MTRHKIFLLVLTVLFLAIAIPRLYYPDLDHGDEHADADALIAGRNFQRLGFIATRFLPIFHPQVPSAQKAYTHYPGLTQVVFALPRVLFGAESLLFPRALALLFSFLNLVFWYLVVWRFSRSREIAFLSALFFLSNPFFIYGIDSIQQLSFGDALRSALLFLFIWSAQGSIQRRRKTCALLWVGIAALSLATFEYIVWLSLFFLLFKLFFREYDYPSGRDILVFLSAPVVGFTLHILQNAWYFGSVSAALQDLGKSAVERIASSADLPVAQLTLATWFQHVIVQNIALISAFNVFVVLLLVFIAYLLYQQQKPDQKQEYGRLMRFLALLFICGLSWYVCFPAHSLAHAYVYYLVRHLLPAAAFGYAVLFWMLFERARSGGGLMRLVSTGVIVIAAVVVVVSGVSRSMLPVTPGAILHADDFLSFKSCLLNLKSESSPSDTLGLNYHRWPPIAYYTDRDCVKISDVETLENAESGLPEYFLFIPYNHPSAQKLMERLLIDYTMMYQCPSARFPAVFLKRKDSS